MKPQQRRDMMVSAINELGSISLGELKKRFPDVSEMTLRRDLEALDNDRRIIRIHGGAKSVDVVIGTDDLSVFPEGGGQARDDIDIRYLGLNGISQKGFDRKHMGSSFLVEYPGQSFTVCQRRTVRSSCRRVTQRDWCSPRGMR